MIPAPCAVDEAGRLEALLEIGVLDTAPEEAFDELATLAGQICGTPIALVSLVDDRRQWFKARVGLEVAQTPRELAFCAHAILRPGLTEIRDAAADERFADNPLVTSAPRIRFYAGAPLVTPEGHALGTLCVIDRVPRDLTEAQRTALVTLSHHVVAQLSLRRQTRALNAEIGERKRVEERLRARNEELQGFAYLVSHDLKAPLRGIFGYAQELERKHLGGLGERARFCVQQVLTASRNLDHLIEDLLHYSRVEAENPTCAELDLPALVGDILRDRSHTVEEHGVEVTVDVPAIPLQGWKRGLTQVLSNLIDNALKYSRGSTPPRLRVGAVSLGETLRLDVSDNGIGFDMRYHDRIFGLFNRLVRAEDFEGTGAGLAIVRKLLEKQGGRVWAEAEPGHGATFHVELPSRPEGATEHRPLADSVARRPAHGTGA